LKAPVTTKNNSFIALFIILCLPFLTGSQNQNDSRVEIYDLRSHTHPSFTRIVVDIGRLHEYNFNQLPSPDRIFVDIYQAKLNPILHGRSTAVDNEYVKQIRIAQKNPTTVRVVVDLDLKKTKRFQVWHIFDPFRIVIDIYPQTTTRDETPEKTPQPAQPTKSGYSMARQLGLGINRIVIDPGHGGKDPGCIGRKGAREKDIVLDVSARLKKLLTTQTRVEVIMTRESDIFIPVENRPVIANQKQADLFISVHANSNPRKNRSGVQTFFLNFSSDPSVIATAALENATSSKNIGEMRSILRKIVRNVKIEESQDLAGKVQSNLVKNLQKSYKNIQDLGVKGGPFWVLIGGDMPSILIEISHLSNLQEESRLKTEKYRQQIAQGIYAGVIDYINSLGKG
jgi:N-acetylmuramoyl-L-alanine amidase